MRTDSLTGDEVVVVLVDDSAEELEVANSAVAKRHFEVSADEVDRRVVRPRADDDGSVSPVGVVGGVAEDDRAGQVDEIESAAVASIEVRRASGSILDIDGGGIRAVSEDHGGAVGGLETVVVPGLSRADGAENEKFRRRGSSGTRKDEDGVRSGGMEGRPGGQGRRPGSELGETGEAGGGAHVAVEVNRSGARVQEQGRVGDGGFEISVERDRSVACRSIEFIATDRDEATAPVCGEAEVPVRGDGAVGGDIPARGERHAPA